MRSAAVPIGDSGGHAFTGPSFYVARRHSLSPASILLAIVTAAGALYGIAYGLQHARHGRFRDDSASVHRSPSSPDATPDDDKDDPSQVDVIALGDPADAPVPATRRSGKASSVHPTILVHLPRFGEEVGLIPPSTAGHLLYGWLAAFNQANEGAMELMLPGEADAASAQMELRRETGGFNLLSAKEVTDGVLIFRLRDQTPAGNEVLGTLQVLPGSEPASIASLSLRATSPNPDTTMPAASPQ